MPVEAGLCLYRTLEGQVAEGGKRNGQAAMSSEAERVEAGDRRTLEACRGLGNESWSQADWLKTKEKEREGVLRVCEGGWRGEILSLHVLLTG